MPLKRNVSFLRRDPAAHKGSCGHVLVAAGSRGMAGAACLCAQAALVSGAGKVTLALPRSVEPIAAAKLTEVITLPLPETTAGALSLRSKRLLRAAAEKATVVAIGPGLSGQAQTRQLVRALIGELNAPLVIDADGLNALAGATALLREARAGVIVTPHPGEMSRLTGAPVGSGEKQRIAVAKGFAAMYNSVTVLKGAGTIIAGPDGAVARNASGNPGMAKAGCGDVLTGIIAGFIAQGAPLFSAARMGVFVHGLAADYACRRMGVHSLLATDIIGSLPQALQAVIKKYMQ
ncbi:MAG: NAD(P)H-hydrate dehydratase [Candidatus Omnitrophica bacterium]|nr:NAD(P)H-hydrate dehydratase [Candidatus Omnitrophota bacterium]